METLPHVTVGAFLFLRGKKLKTGKLSVSVPFAAIALIVASTLGYLVARLGADRYHYSTREGVFYRLDKSSGKVHFSHIRSGGWKEGAN